jgi:hypothetical protein
MPTPLPPDDYPGPTPDPEMVAAADELRRRFAAEDQAAEEQSRIAGQVTTGGFVPEPEAP